MHHGAERKGEGGVAMERLEAADLMVRKLL